MSNSTNPMRALMERILGEDGDSFPDERIPRGAWSTVDALYIWSAVAGLLVAIVLIAIAQVMKTGRLF